MPKWHHYHLVNRGALSLKRARGTGTIDELAALLGIDRTYCGRILSDDRRPGLALRKTARDRFGIAIEAWDEDVPDPEHTDEAVVPTGTES